MIQNQKTKTGTVEYDNGGDYSDVLHENWFIEEFLSDIKTKLIIKTNISWTVFKKWWKKGKVMLPWYVRKIGIKIVYFRLNMVSLGAFICYLSSANVTKRRISVENFYILDKSSKKNKIPSCLVFRLIIFLPSEYVNQYLFVTPLWSSSLPTSN